MDGEKESLCVKELCVLRELPGKDVEKLYVKARRVCVYICIDVKLLAGACGTNVLPHATKLWA